MATQPKPRLSPEEYLTRERLAETKSGYYQGEVFALASATEKHILIVTNLVLALGNNLRKRDCGVYSNDMRVLVSDTGLYTYPDVAVVCGNRIFAEAQRDVLANPSLIIEVLSESTKDYDPGGKFHQSMRIPSLLEYLTVSQTEMLIDHSISQADDSWLLREIRPSQAKIPLHSLGIELDFDDIYDKVEVNRPAA